MVAKALDLIDAKRAALKIDVPQERVLFDMDMRREHQCRRSSRALRSAARTASGRQDRGQALAEAKESLGADHAVEFPNTGYYLPVIYGLTGEKVEKLSDMDRVLDYAADLLPEVPTEHLWLPYLGTTLDAGIATLFADECHRGAELPRRARRP